MTASTKKVPTTTEARAAAKAHRDSQITEKDTKIIEKRTLLYGQVLDRLEDVMKDDDVDDIIIMELVLGVLNADTKVKTKPATSKSPTSLIARLLK